MYEISSSSSDSSSQSKDSKSSLSSTSLVWSQYFDDSDWGAIDGTWNDLSDRWESAEAGDQIVLIEAEGDWADGYRPTKMRLTIEIPGHANANLNISVSSMDDSIYSVSNMNVVSEESFECDLTFAGSASHDDIRTARASQENGYQFYITNIEFLSEEAPPSSSLSKTSKSSISESSRSCSHSKISLSSDSLSVSSISWRREIAAVFNLIENTNVSLSSSESSQSIRSFPKGY
jgi:hypothetical protein